MENMLVDTSSGFTSKALSQIAADEQLLSSFRTVASFLSSLANSTKGHSTPSVLSLKAVVEQYHAIQLQQAKSGELSWSFRNRQKWTLDVWARECGDMSVSDITSDKLVDYFGRLKDRTSSGLAPDTIQTEIKGIRLFLNWLEDTGKWKPAFSMSKIFQVRTQKLFTLSEMKKRAQGQDVFTPDELSHLYRTASRRQKLYILLGLNLAATQMQMSDLVMSDLHLDAKKPYVEFIRSKTRHSGVGTIGHYELWPETVELLREAVNLTPRTPEGWALLTKDGEKLVRFQPHNGSRCDPVLMSWKKLLDKAKMPSGRGLTFKYLRKTIADMVLRESDEATQQQMLAHARVSIAGRHYTGRSDFSRLSKVLHKIRFEVVHSMFA